MIHSEERESTSDRLRVLHVYSGNLYGGIEKFLVTLAKYAADAPGMRPAFALCFEGRLRDELLALGATVYDLGEVRARAPWTVLRARRTLEHVAREGAFDAIVCHSPWAQAMFGDVPRAAKIPGIFWLHEGVSGRHWLERFARRTRPSFCVANSQFSRTTLGLLFRDVPSAVLYCPVMPSAVTLSEEERRAVRRELGADDETVVILQTSRMQPLKGQKRLLRAMAQLPAEPRTLCVEVGGPQRPEEQRYFDELHAFAADLGLGERVRFLGERSDVPRLLAASDVYCQPNSLPDSFGIVLIEALAAGVPIVTADIGGPREIVTPEVGFLVGDDRSLASTLELLAKSPALRKELGARGPARAHELCAPSLRLPEMKRVLAGAVRGGAPPGRAA